MCRDIFSKTFTLATNINIANIKGIYTGMGF